MIFCGVDGGGTKTKIVLSKDNQIIQTITSTASSIDTVAIEETKRVVEEALKNIYLEESLPKVNSIFLGLGGISSLKDIEMVNKKIREIPYIDKNAFVSSGNDITNAYFSACSGRNNITLIIGTGSVAFGKDEQGNEHKVSGISFKEGDFGSGYDIGKNALIKMSKAFDGRIPHSQLTMYLLEKFNIQNLSDLIKFFDENYDQRTIIASLAKCVVYFAETGDLHALDIIDKATDETLLNIMAVDNKINLKNREIGIIGGLGNSSMYFEFLRKKVKKYDSAFKIHGAEMQPEIASLELAKKQVN